MVKVERVPLQSVAEIDRVGVTPMAMGDKPYVSLEDIDSVSGAVQVASREQSKSTKFRFDQKHVLYGKLRPYLQKVARPTRAGLCSTDILPIRPSDRLDRDYLFHFLRTPDFTVKATRAAVGVNLPRLSPSVLSTFDIPLPTLNEQKRIAGILDAADALRAKRRESLVQLDALLQSTFLDMFGDPDQWAAVSMESIAQTGRGTFSNGPFGSNLLTSELTATGIPVVYIRDIRDAEYKRVSEAFVTAEKAAELETSQTLPGDVLVAKVGDPPGVAAVYPAGEPLGVITQDVIRIRPDLEVVGPSFLAGYLNSTYGKRKIREITVEATRARFGLRDFKAQTIPLPPLDLQHRFAAIVESVEQQKARLRAHVAELDALFASLQSRAFKGEL